MHLLRSLALLLCCLAAWPLAAKQPAETLAVPAALETLAAQLSKHPAVAMPFKQTQQLAGMDAPFLAAGEITVSASEGLVWAMTEPFPSAQWLPLQGQAIDQFGEALPHHPVVTEILLALFQFDLPRLQQHFVISSHTRAAANDASAWSLELTPSLAWLENEITAIELAGEQVLNTVLIRYPDGTVSTMRFAELKPVSESGWAQRLALFP